MNNKALQRCITQAQGGNVAAMGQLYDAYYDRLASYAVRRVLDQYVAEDIVSNVFVAVLEQLPRFEWRHQHSFNGWIYRIASNEVNQYFRKQSRYEFVPPRDMDDVYSQIGEHQFSTHRLERELDARQDFMRLHGCIRQLKPRHQDIIHLFYFENLSHREIAGALSMREGSVRVTLSRSTAKLKQIMSNNAMNAQKEAA